MGWIILIIIASAILWAAISASNLAAMQNAQDKTFSDQFKGWDYYISPHNRSVLALNRQAKQIALGPVTAPKQYSLDQVTQVEVLRDGASITSTNRGSQIAGAAIGALAFGGLGLLLGGLTGSKRNKATIHSIALKVLVDDGQTPVHVVEFFKSPDNKGTDAQSSFVVTAAEKLDHFHALLVNALKQVVPSGAAIESVASQISRLWELREAGALSDEEFAEQKKRLLDASGPDQIWQTPSPSTSRS